jgi:hypothetical protein
LKSFLDDNYNSQPPGQKFTLNSSGQLVTTDPKILHNDAKIVTALSYKF